MPRRTKSIVCSASLRQFWPPKAAGDRRSVSGYCAAAWAPRQHDQWPRPAADRGAGLVQCRRRMLARPWEIWGLVNRWSPASGQGSLGAGSALGIASVALARVARILTIRTRSTPDSDFVPDDGEWRTHCHDRGRPERRAARGQLIDAAALLDVAGSRDAPLPMALGEHASRKPAHAGPPHWTRTWLRAPSRARSLRSLDSVHVRTRPRRSSQRAQARPGLS